MNKTEIRTLVAAAQMKDNSALNTLVENHTDLIWSIVHRFKTMGGDIEDLFQVGCIGLLKAIDGFNPAFETTLTTYAVPLIIGEIKAYLRSLTPIKVSRQVKMNAYKIAIAKDELAKKLGREPLVTELVGATGIDEEHVVIALNAPTQATSLDYVDGDEAPLFERIADPGENDFDERVVLKELISKIDKQAQALLYFRYDLGLTQAEVAERLSMNQVAVSRMERKVLLLLREKMS